MHDAVLTKNYHMHTRRCGHATGTDRQYVEEAIRCGYQTIGFSDHTPYPFPNGYVSHIRMSCDMLSDYVESVLSLKKEYQSDIRILLGLEVEYYASCFSDWKKMTDAYPFDYFLLGQHSVPEEYSGVYSGNPTRDEHILRIYVDTVIEALETGTFLYLAHPDLLRFTDSRSKVYDREMRRLCLYAKEHAVPLEINLLGIEEHRWYPNLDFWKIAGDVGNDVVIGVDAHHPNRMNAAHPLDYAMKMIHDYQLNWKQDLL